MCLSRIADEETKEKYKNKKTMWKVFFYKGGKVNSVHYGYSPLPVGEWLDEEAFRPDRNNIPLMSAFGHTYPFGFHGYVRKDDALMEASLLPGAIAVKVSVADVREVGFEGLAPVLVVGKIKLCNFPRVL